MSKAKKNNQPRIRASKRLHRHTFVLNEQENRALERYVKKYKIKNKSKFMRELLMIEVISRLEKDQPTLFECLNNNSD